MRGKQFNAYLRLTDADSKLLAENDDIPPPAKSGNARIWFVSPADGVYRVIPASFMQQGRGDYVIIVREYSSAKQE